MAHLNRISLVSLVALGVAMPAFAQNNNAQPAQEPEAGRDVVVITANKREETVGHGHRRDGRHVRDAR